MQDLDKFKNEMNLSGKNVYVGNRYVPKMMGDWDKEKLYEPLSVVTYQGASYTSRQYVPTGVEITNEDFWVLSGNYNAQVEHYRQEVLTVNKEVKTGLKQVNDEVVNARNGEQTLTARLDKDQQEVKTGLKQVNDEVVNARNGEQTLTARLAKDQQEVNELLAKTNQRFEENPNPSIGKGPKDTRPVITIVTDDARRQDITIFKDMFQRVGLPVSTAVSPNRNINTPDYGNVYLTVDEIRTLQDEFGWEIVSHTWDHERLTEISDEQLDFTLKKSRDWLRDNGFKGYEYLMYPFGLYDERVKRVTAKYYKAARTTAGLWGNVINQYPVSSYQLSTRFFSQTVSLDIIKADIDRVIERGGWLNIFFHSWEIDDWNRESDFEEMLNYIKSKQSLGLVDVMGYKDTYEKYGNVIDQTSYVDKTDDMFIVQQNGTVRTNFGKTKKIANNSLNNSSLPSEFPIDYISYMTNTLAENDFPTPSGTLETINFNPNPNEPTNNRYCRQTYYPYNSSLIYTRGYLASGWTQWVTQGGGYGGSRPEKAPLGFMFFDATIGKPIWYKSDDVWVDSTGATV